MFKGKFLLAALLILLPHIGSANTYKIDPTHTFVEFRIKHLGYSWLYGRFNDIEGSFSHDAANPGDNKININVDTTSVDTNHAERDKHLRNDDFLHVDKFPKSSFVSTGFKGDAEKGVIEGDLTLNGVTKRISIDVSKIGEGKDPWGGYRAGFLGKTVLTRKDFGIDYNLGPASETVELEISIEGIKK